MEQNWFSTFFENRCFFVFLIICVVIRVFEKGFGYLLLIWSIQKLVQMCRNFWIYQIYKRLVKHVSKTRFTCSKSHQKQGANPRSHANVQLFSVIHVFESLIEGFRSWEYRIRYQIDLLYILNCSNPKQGWVFSIFSKTKSQKGPAGGFFADKIIFCVRNASRRGFMGGYNCI